MKAGLASKCCCAASNSMQSLHRPDSIGAQYTCLYLAQGAAVFASFCADMTAPLTLRILAVNSLLDTLWVSADERSSRVTPCASCCSSESICCPWDLTSSSTALKAWRRTGWMLRHSWDPWRIGNRVIHLRNIAHDHNVALPAVGCQKQC